MWRQSIKAGEIRATVLQPVVRLSQMAVEQANKYVTDGKTGADEKQSVDCVLISPDNVKNYTSFGGRTSGCLKARFGPPGIDGIAWSLRRFAGGILRPVPGEGRTHSG